MEYIGDMFRVLLSLVFVLGIFYLIVKFLKNKNQLFQQTGQMKVLEKCYLSNDKVIYLVKIVDNVWVVSTSKEKVEFIEKIDIEKIGTENINNSDFSQKGKG